VILHEWTDAVSCKQPVRGRWGDDERGRSSVTHARKNGALRGERARPGDLAKLLVQPAPALVAAAQAPAVTPPTPTVQAKPETRPTPRSGGCHAAGHRAPPSASSLLLLAAGLLWRAARRRARRAAGA